MEYSRKHALIGGLMNEYKTSIVKRKVASFIITQ